MREATLLHYISANGVEEYRQKTPKNVVEVAKVCSVPPRSLMRWAAMYGGQRATMSMLVSSSHPAEARVRIALINTLVDYAASLEPCGSGQWTSPLMTALVFGFRSADEALVVRRGARVDNIAAAAGLGRLDEARELLATATGEDRHRALALAAQHGHVGIVRLLLDAW